MPLDESTSPRPDFQTRIRVPLFRLTRPPPLPAPTPTYLGYIPLKHPSRRVAFVAINDWNGGEILTCSGEINVDRLYIHKTDGKTVQIVAVLLENEATKDDVYIKAFAATFPEFL